jgi:hypothetical protein
MPLGAVEADRPASLQAEVGEDLPADRPKLGSIVVERQRRQTDHAWKFRGAVFGTAGKLGKITGSIVGAAPGHIVVIGSH